MSILFTNRLRLIPIIEEDHGSSISIKDYKTLQKKIVQLERENDYKKSYHHISKKSLHKIVAFIRYTSYCCKKNHHHSGNYTVIEQENLLKQNFSATTINQKWCTDITYIYTLRNG